MGCIIVLDENTSNKIAAGEVVEKPASVVKELVENSIDAGATSISVDIKNGGISYIKVTDNGSGMEEDDIEIAFERHATSKIKKADDLDSIITMGFRGEALASIAAVSSVTLQTKTARSTYGMHINISGGIVKEVRQTGCPVGTTFIVKDLFFNTPARYKFLKKDSTETGYISDTISRMALGNPQISFRLTSGKTNLVYTPGNNDLQSTIFSIYGKDIVKELINVNYQDEKLKITGFVGRPEVARANRNYQSLYINKRYVKSRLVSYAVEQAYNSILMKNKFPFYVLSIELSPYMVDANVHPNKMDVRFAEESYLSRSIYLAVSSALNSSTLFNPVAVTTKDREIFKFNNIETKDDYVQEPLMPAVDKGLNQNKTVHYPVNSFVQSPKQSLVSEHTQAATERVPDKLLEPMNVFSQDELVEATDMYVQDKVKDNFQEAKNIDDTLKESNKVLGCNDLQELSSVPTFDTLQQTTKVSVKQQATKVSVEQQVTKVCAENSAQDTANAYVEIDRIKNMKFIGQVFSTYILLQSGDELVMIDQHAAHERILYERLKNKFENQENITQLLLEPVVIQLQGFEHTVVKAKAELFKKIGFNFEDFGNNSIIIRGVPYLVTDCSPKELFLELMDKLQELVKPANTPLADEVLHTIACKAAIKANKKLTELEVNELLEELSNTGSKYTCPHGRPTVIRLTKYEIEKMFKRIV